VQRSRHADRLLTGARRDVTRWHLPHPGTPVLETISPIDQRPLSGVRASAGGPLQAKTLRTTSTAGSFRWPMSPARSLSSSS